MEKLDGGDVRNCFKKKRVTKKKKENSQKFFFGILVVHKAKAFRKQNWLRYHHMAQIGSTEEEQRYQRQYSQGCVRITRRFSSSLSIGEEKTQT